MINFEHRVYKYGTLAGFMLLIFMMTNVYFAVQKIPVIETKIDSIKEENVYLKSNFDSLENMVYSNDKRISIIESH